MPTIRVLEEALAKTPPSVPRLRVLPANLPRAKLFPSIPPIKLWNVPPVEVPFEKESLEWAAREGERKQAAIVTRDATLADAGGDTCREASGAPNVLGDRRYVRRVLCEFGFVARHPFLGLGRAPVMRQSAPVTSGL